MSLDWIQWPAMAVTVFAAWLVASKREFKRNWGFWCFLASNVLWTAWGLWAHAYALIVLQVCLAVLNIRGTVKNRATPDGAEASEAADEGAAEEAAEGAT